MNTTLLGAVLAGGRGVRFGGGKSGALVAGVPMVERAVTTLAAVFDHVVVVGDEGVGAAPGLPDLRAGAGPLGGLETALHEATRRGLDGVFLLACDLPLVTPDVVRAVITHWGGGASVLAPARAGGVEATCAAYAVEVLDLATEGLERGDGSLHALFRVARGEALDLAGVVEPSAFLNVNTTADRARAEAILSAQGAAR